MHSPARMRSNDVAGIDTTTCDSVDKGGDKSKSRRRLKRDGICGVRNKHVRRSAKQQELARGSESSGL